MKGILLITIVSHLISFMSGIVLVNIINKYCEED